MLCCYLFRFLHFFVIKNCGKIFRDKKCRFEKRGNTFWRFHAICYNYKNKTKSVKCWMNNSDSIHCWNLVKIEKKVKKVWNIVIMCNSRTNTSLLIFFKTRRTLLFAIVLTLSVFSSSSNALHIQGTFNPKEEFFHFLAKFGFQKTELRRRDDSQGFIYGNITLLRKNETMSAGVYSIKLSNL